MYTKQEIEKWLMSLVNQNMTEPHEALVNPAELSDKDVRSLYYTISNSFLLNIVAQNRDDYTSKVFFTWFFQLAARLPMQDVITMFIHQHNRRNVLQSLFISNHAHSIGLWMAWVNPLLKEFKVNPDEIFFLLSQKGDYFELGNGLSSPKFLAFLVHQRRELFNMLISWMDELFPQLGNLVNESMIKVLQMGLSNPLFDDLISVQDQKSLNGYLLFIQNIYTSDRFDPAVLLVLICRVNDPKHYTNKLASMSAQIKQLYETLVGELLLASAQNGNQLRNRYDAICNLKSLEPIKIKGATLPEADVRPLMLKFIDRLPDNERPDAFKIALDKKHPFGKYMLLKSWFPTAEEKAFEDKITVMSKWRTQTLKARVKESGQPMHAVLFQPAAAQVPAPNAAQPVIRNSKT